MWTGELDDARFELKARAFGVPLALLGAWLFSALPFGAFVERTFLGMWLHELGHAAASWFTGYSAVPLPWFTVWSDERSALVTVVLVGVLAAGAVAFARAERPVPAAWCGAGVVLALLGRLAVPAYIAEQWQVFGGEAGAMLFGALFVTSFFARRTSQLVRGAVRWGLLVWGAAAWADATRLWVEVRKDYARMPFGLEDGHASDATQLVDTFHWREDVLINRHLLMAKLTFALMAVAWLYGVAVQWRRFNALKPTPGKK